jgi:hypothetical protein
VALAVSGALGAAAAEPALAPTVATGILLDRLSSEELRKWQSIARLSSTRRGGAPLYPTLAGLLDWARGSENPIYIELSSDDCALTSTAGRFLIERSDPHATRHIGVIRLCLANIDRVGATGGERRANGLVRFAGLRGTKRYAEVLGHELAHAASDFASPERARLVWDRVDRVSAEFRAHRAWRGNEPLDPALKRRLEERDALLVELEAHADAVELLVWRELVKAGGARR